MEWNRIQFSAIALVGVLHFMAFHGFAAAAPTVEQALSFKPIQPNVNYAQPSKEEIAQCTIRSEKQSAAWVVRNAGGETLRRFADTNGDNVVDLWCYYNDGLESYRDIDSDFNQKADQYRWFQASGTRWGIDKNEDGRIDTWQVISAPEVAEELVYALKMRDRARFELLLASSSELADTGFGPERAGALEKARDAATAAFATLATSQKVFNQQSDFADFYRTRPATIPAGTDGSTKDVTIYDNASALVTTGDKHEQLYLGTLIAGRRHVEIDRCSDDRRGQQADAAGNAYSQYGRSCWPGADRRRTVGRSTKTDGRARKARPASRAGRTGSANTAHRASRRDPQTTRRHRHRRRHAWRMGASIGRHALQLGAGPECELCPGARTARRAGDGPGGEKRERPLVSYVKYRRMYADYALSQQAPNADIAKIQEKWLTDLETFVNENPASPDAAEAMLNLGMSYEFAGATDKAKDWYGKLARDFPNTPQAKKANGVLLRLNSIGKPLRFAAKDIKGRPVNLANYRNRVVLIQFWSTIDDRCQQDMDALKDIYAKYGGRGGFEIIGVCLDRDPKVMQGFLAQNRYLWAQVQEPGGFDGELANQLGVMTLPMMILVDQKGTVVADNIFVANLEGELKRLLGAAAAQNPPSKQIR